MPRKPTATPASDEPQIKPEILEAISETQNATSLLSSEYSDDRDTLNQMMGQIQMSGAIAKLTTVIGLTKLAYIKENKMYRALQGKKSLDVEGNEIADVSTWEGFCLAIGTTRQKVDEDLRNLSAFGEEALADLNRVGAGYREMRQYRRLPEDAKQALIEVAKTGDKEQFVDLAEEIIAKHTRERDEWSKREQEYKDDIDAKEAVAETNRKRIDELQEQTARLKKMTPDEIAQQFRTELNLISDEVEERIRVQLNESFLQLQNYNEEIGTDATDYIASRLDLLEKALLDVRSNLGIAQTVAAPSWEDQE